MLKQWSVPPFQFYHNNGVCYVPLLETLHSYNCQVYEANAIMISRSDKPLARLLLTTFTMLDPSPECRLSIILFYCLYLFGLCDGDGEQIQPTQEQCRDTQFRVCAREWSLAVQYGLSLPECNLLPSL